MNKDFFNQKWGMRLISLVFAIFLYIFVASENNAFTFQSAANQQFASVNVTETLSNVPVSVGDIGENRFISGLPESVQVRLTGPKNVITQVMETSIRAETEDLSEAEPGSQYIRLVIDDLPDSIDYQVTPSQVYVKLSQLESISATVEYQIDENAIAEGYQVANVTMNPNQIELVGDIDTIREIDRVVINITRPRPATESFTDTYSIKITNSDGEILDVNTSNSEIEARVEVVSQRKEVGLYVIPFGYNQADYQYQYQILSPNSLVISGDLSAINSIESIGIYVDVTGIYESTVVRGDIQLLEGVEVVGENNVQVEVQVSQIQSSISENPSLDEPVSSESVIEERPDETVEDPNDNPPTNDENTTGPGSENEPANN